MDSQDLERFAELTLRVGVNMQPDQIVAIRAYPEHAPFVQSLSDAAYRQGARYVEVDYLDPIVKRSRILHASQDSLEWVPPWDDALYDTVVERKGALVAVIGEEDPGLFNDLDPTRVGRVPRLTPGLLRAIRSNEVNWTVVPFPTEGWARKLYGVPDTGRLWTELARCMRLDAEDPLAAWQRHINRLAERGSIMNGHSFDALHYRGPGTDLTVGLMPQSRWLSGAMSTNLGTRYVANLPTEEVFTAPHRERVDGSVRSTKPLALLGTIVEGLELEFTAGKAVRVSADRGAGIVQTEMARDEGAPRLGEIALVDETSRVGEIGRVFFEVLLDENAASHIAYGAAFPQNVEGAGAMSDEEQLAVGMNASQVHTDFMVGSPEVEIIGIHPDGSRVTIIKDNVWELSS